MVQTHTNTNLDVFGSSVDGIFVLHDTGGEECIRVCGIVIHREGEKEKDVNDAQ